MKHRNLVCKDSSKRARTHTHTHTHTGTWTQAYWLQNLKVTYTYLSFPQALQYGVPLYHRPHMDHSGSLHGHWQAWLGDLQITKSEREHKNSFYRLWGPFSLLEQVAILLKTKQQTTRERKNTTTTMNGWKLHPCPMKVSRSDIDHTSKQ